MKRIFAITVVMLLSSAMFFVVVCAGAGPVTKPFHGMWSGNIYLVGPCTDTNFPPTEFPSPPFPPPVQVINVGKGVSTITGESDFFSVYCNYFTSETTMAGSGWAILTAANGDVLHLRIAGTLNLDTGAWTEEEWAEGGTGRFKDATGETESGGNIIAPTDPDLFPYNANIPPRLIQAPAFWVGTTKGWIMY